MPMACARRSSGRIPRSAFFCSKYESPRSIQACGTMLRADATFDNSPNNRFNPDAKAEVRWGDQTWEKMMVGFSLGKP
jgi:hypothetical protein